MTALVACLAVMFADPIDGIAAYSDAQGRPAEQQAKPAPAGSSQASAPAIARVAAPPATQAGYPSRSASGRRWTHEGRSVTADHLATTHGFDRAWLATLSQSQLESLHADAHEGQVRPQAMLAGRAAPPPAQRVLLPAQQPLRRESCPNGQCPSVRSFRIR